MRQREFRLPKLFTFADLLLLLAVGGSSFAFYGFRFWQSRFIETGPTQVVIQAGKQIVAQLDLSQDTTLAVEGALGDVTVVVSGGRVSFVNAHCPLEICEKTGEINHKGEVIVCAPNQIMAKIVGSGPEDSGSLDGVSR